MFRHRYRAAGLATVLLLAATVAQADKGVILDQQLYPNGRGYTVIRVWGSNYEMGWAQAGLLGDAIVQGVSQTKSYLGTYRYSLARNIMATAAWRPPGLEDEFDGLVARLALTHPAAQIDKLDLKVVCTLGDWLYGGCRSHTCWGRYVAAPIRTLSTRRLDFITLIPMMNHHVLCVRVPTDGAPEWVNLAWPGLVTAATGVNEFGTIVSLHDYQCQTDLAANRLPRMVACRYALTLATDPNVSTHLTAVFDELRNYETMTGSFINYYAPEGHGGVMVCHPFQSPDFYYLRRPQPVWHHGEALITTNAWTDGTYTPADEDFGADAYYNDERPKTLESHWTLLTKTGGGLHMLSVAYRGRGDLTVWADGRLDGIGRTPRLEWEWPDLVGVGDLNCDGRTDFGDINPFVMLLSNPGAYATEFPDCLPRNGDINRDGQVDFGDINPFVRRLTGR